MSMKSMGLSFLVKMGLKRTSAPQSDNAGDRHSKPAADSGEEKPTRENLEKRILHAGEKVVLGTLTRHYQGVQKAHNKYSLSNQQLISAEIATSKDVPRSLRKRVGHLAMELQKNFWGIAQGFEDQNFQSVEDALSKIQFSEFDRRRVEEVFDAQKSLHVSYQSIRLAVEVFRGINRNLLDEIEQARSLAKRQTETGLLLKNAILVHELAAAIVDLLRSFQLQGKDRLLEVRRQIFQEIENNRRQDEELRRKCTDRQLAPSVREQALNSIRTREQLREIVQAQWDGFIRQLDQVDGNVKVVTRQISNLEMIRDNAKNQLGFLQIVAVTQMIKDNLEAVQGLLQIEDIPLAPVTPDDLCRLLGIALGSETLPP